MSKRTIIGSFGKALDGSISINFGTSGGTNCDPGCVHHPRSTAENATRACYAKRAELRPDRSQLAAKLRRHAVTHPATVCNRAILEIQGRLAKGQQVPWLRISTNGSLPQPEKVRGHKGFAAALRALVDLCRKHGIPCHIPVETWAKARFYRGLLGDLAVVRESAQSARRFVRASGAVSTVAGCSDQSRIERVETARSVALERRTATGRKTVVCPAVLNSFAARRDPSKKHPRAKCGACVACAMADVDVVYPLH